MTRSYSAIPKLRLRLPPVAIMCGGGGTDGRTRAGLLCEALRRLAKQRSPCHIGLIELHVGEDELDVAGAVVVIDLRLIGDVEELAIQQLLL